MTGLVGMSGQLDWSINFDGIMQLNLSCFVFYYASTTSLRKPGSRPRHCDHSTGLLSRLHVIWIAGGLTELQVEFEGVDAGVGHGVAEKRRGRIQRWSA